MSFLLWLLLGWYPFFYMQAIIATPAAPQRHTSTARNANRR